MQVYHTDFNQNQPGVQASLHDEANGSFQSLLFATHIKTKFKLI
jgi:hypothetical protein